MWYALIGSLALFSLAGAVYLVFRFHRFSPIKKLGERSKPLSWTVAVLPVALIACFNFVNTITMIVVMLHFVVGFAVCGTVGFIVGRIRKKKVNGDITGICALILVFVYLGAGWFLGHRVFETYYAFTTEKPVEGSIRIAVISDVHLGVTLDGEGFARLLDRIEEKEPDILVVVGDYVDDDSSKEDMVAACRALGEFKSTRGVYYVHGNHDRGYFDKRDFTGEQLRTEFEKNGVTVLEATGVDLGNGYYLVGRNDRSMRDRAPAEELTAGIGDEKYVIMLDHPPNDYDAEAASGADLVISGHTHGGQIIPAGAVGMMIGANDRRYGTERRGGTDFVVTSGVSGWAIPIKTGAISEYVIIDVGGD